MNRVVEAFHVINRDAFVKREDGSQVTQSTADHAIQKGLEMLNVKVGNRVLEIGTGSGFSGALLSHLVGMSGSVVSLDIDPQLTERAKKLFDRHQIRNVQFETRDGRKGYEKQSGYDRIIAWTTPERLPNAWIDQLAESGKMLAPFRVLPLANCMVMVCFRKEKGELKGGEVIEGSYIPMTEEPVIQFFGPEVHADWRGKGEELIWASSDWLKKDTSEEWERKFLMAQIKNGHFQESGKAIRAYLIGKYPKSITTAFRPDSGHWIGYSTPKGFALVSMRENKCLISDENHGKVLDAWWEEWGKLGKPSYQDLVAYLVDSQVKVKLKNGDDWNEISTTSTD
ncbi:methyltransferase domain-containing protein [Hazenella sp. IB182357]|uniref:Protein-L-isoaspartate O-methyltransferase n=1 Tax=Polycladospora coralii TaxID=2771432 RepID=A0A926NB11_9BACL|nr:methyltransferase domain-containing protein [Polycladospora coralii]MBD1372837.1 methyltransferase domain-containing protein [Polycladospora coralii]